MDKVLELLTKGREFFADHEWERGGDYYRTGPGGDVRSCCAQGALLGVLEFDKAPLDSDLFDAACGALSRALRALRAPGAYSVTAYNDRVAESKDEILDLYDRAIAARRSS